LPSLPWPGNASEVLITWPLLRVPLSCSWPQFMSGKPVMGAMKE
jgi:hypothetical protein